MFPPNFAWGAATSAYQIEGKTRGRSDCNDYTMLKAQTL